MRPSKSARLAGGGALLIAALLTGCLFDLDRELSPGELTGVVQVVLPGGSTTSWVAAAGAEVTLVGTDTRVTTDGNGRFDIRGLASGAYTVAITDAVNGEVIGFYESPPLTIPSGDGLDLGTLQLGATGSIYGEVLLSGSPLANAELQVLDSQGLPFRGIPAVMSDTAGSYSIPYLPAGSERVRAVFDTAAQQLTATSQPITVVPWTSTEVTLQLNALANVTCETDSNCPSGFRCCPGDGTCNPVVADGADCDCHHPCTGYDGCFTGPCGQTPAQCRPACNPGNATTPAQACPSQNGVPAWCSPLTAGEMSPDAGGACTPSDDCDIAQQNCPDLPLDRSLPESATNPMVPYTCVPASPTTTQCMPAGTVPPGGTNCTYGCGNDTTNCAKGYECVQLEGPCTAGAPGCQCSGSTCYGPSGPPQCLQQCTDPSEEGAPSPQCSNGGPCLLLYGNGDVAYQTGDCAPPDGGTSAADAG